MVQPDVNFFPIALPGCCKTGRMSTPIPGKEWKREGELKGEDGQKGKRERKIKGTKGEERVGQVKTREEGKGSRKAVEKKGEREGKESWGLTCTYRPRSVE